MKAVTVAALVMSLFQGLAGSPTVSKRVDFDKKLKEKLEKFRHLEIINGKFERMKPTSPEEEELFKRVESLAFQKKSSFAMSIDNFQGNDLVSDKIYRLNPRARPYTHKNNQFAETTDDEEPGSSTDDQENIMDDSLDQDNDNGPSSSQEPQQEEAPLEFALHSGEESDENGEGPAGLDQEALAKKRIANNITGFHMDIIRCMDDHERAPTYSSLSFQEISDDCLGSKKRLIRAFYNDIAFQTKQFVLNRIKKRLKVGACDQNFVICVEFFRAIQLATEMGLALVETMRANSESIANTIGEDKLNFLYILSLSSMKDYEELVALLAKEKTKLMSILAGKSNNHEVYSGYVPNKPPPVFIPPPPKPEDFIRLGSHLPGDPVEQPKRFDGSNYSENLRFATVPFEKHKTVVKQTKTKFDESEYMVVEKPHSGKGKKPVDFPETSEELDAMHMKAHELMRYRLKEQASLPVTSNVFRKAK
jgi:hypothetical protein